MSCTNLAPTCGPTSSSDCCESPVVTGGMFYRSYDVAADMAYTDMSYPATVSSFHLDKYEVTVGRFRSFVAAEMGTQQNPPATGAGGRTLNGMTNQGGWDPSFTGSLPADATALVAAINCGGAQTWTDTPGGNENRPMNCLTWYEAMAFCIWEGGSLPTEAEWNYAAAGGNEQRAYPWSNPPDSTTIDCTVANFGGSNPPATACVAGGTNDVGATSPAGDGAWGQSDLAGNVWEWTLDWYASPYPQSPCTSCANLTPATNRVLRGGDHGDVASALRTAYRVSVLPTYRGSNSGVRCARSAP